MRQRHKDFVQLVTMRQSRTNNSNTFYVTHGRLMKHMDVLGGWGFVRHDVWAILESDKQIKHIVCDTWTS